MVTLNPNPTTLNPKPETLNAKKPNPKRRGRRVPQPGSGLSAARLDDVAQGLTAMAHDLGDF